ncbi:MAG: ABC transporter permease [Verrucomicrobia bacterium]|nr:ABC transporter permease [Verrucomicrobiota bacterium]
MNFWSAIEVGFKEIWAHKFRSLLTMLGIVLGVSSLVAMAALVKGMENGMKEALIAIGGLEKVRVEEQDIPAKQRQYTDDAVGCTINDVYALERSAPLVTLVEPEMRMPSYYRVTRDGKMPDWVNLIGTWPSALEMNEHIVQYGRMFNDIDDENARNVCVIGTYIRDELFGAPDEVGHEIIPLGQTININGEPFRIIGMFQRYESERERKQRELQATQPKAAPQTGPKRSRGWGGHKGGGFVFGWKNRTIYIPLNTMWLRFRAATGTNNIPDPHLSALNLKVASVDELEPALQQARNVLMSTHHGIEDFRFQTQEDWAQNITSAIHHARLSGGFISAISLLVGGIGIMNIMLASITERIREIGIRKAIGATYADVFVQILIESVVIALLGGLAGLAAAYGLVYLLQTLSPTENTPIITFTALGVAFLFSAGVGVLAGLVPAFKAAKLDPIQALRYD